MGGFYRPRDTATPTSIPTKVVNAARPEPMWIDMLPDFLVLPPVAEAAAVPVTVTNPPRIPMSVMILTRYIYIYI
jgi:hypothetical protein